MKSSQRLVRLKGFEPPTYWFVASHSIQLSYSRIFDFTHSQGGGRVETKKLHAGHGASLVRLKGFEPPTYWFVASHSIQLSYSRISRASRIALSSAMLV